MVCGGEGCGATGAWRQLQGIQSEADVFASALYLLAIRGGLWACWRVPVCVARQAGWFGMMLFVGGGWVGDTGFGELLA